MPIRETINTIDEQYQTALTRWRQIRSMMKPRIKHWLGLSEDQQRAWLQRDPLLRELIRFAERVADASEE